MIDQLTDGEEVLYVGSRSIYSGLLTKVLITCLSLITGSALLIGITMLSCALLTYLDTASTKLFITNRRVLGRYGLFTTSTVDLKMNKIEGVQVCQNILGGILNFGDLVFSGTGTTKISVSGVSDPLKFKKTFEEASNRYNIWRSRD